MLARAVLSATNHKHSRGIERNRAAWRSGKGFAGVRAVLVLAKMLYAQKHIGNRSRGSDKGREKQERGDAEEDITHLSYRLLHAF